MTAVMGAGRAGLSHSVAGPRTKFGASSRYESSPAGSESLGHAGLMARCRWLHMGSQPARGLAAPGSPVARQ